MNIRIDTRIDEKRGLAILEFTCGIIEPQELTGYQPLDPVVNGFSNKGVVIKGAMPQWLISYYTHVLHPTLFIAISVPRINSRSAVVVATHSRLQKVGDIITY